LKRLPQLELFTIDQAFGGWERAQAKFFASGGIFDQINTLGK
jgi:sulfate transport system substrate-binding protein